MGSSFPQIADLPIVPCYKDKNCDSNFNCGELCDPSGAQLCPTDSNYFQDPCWGSNPNNCQGILPFCDPNDPDTRCPVENDNPTMDGALNSNNQYMGCNITTNQTTYPPGYENNSISECVEFKTPLDKVADCGTSCWSDGGYDYIRNFCENQIGRNKYQCKAMEYFCEWDESQNICTLPELRRTTTPLENYALKYGRRPDLVQSIPVRRDCGGIERDCIEIDDPNYTNNLFVTSAQSLWDSSQQTSYDPNSRINCVHDLITGSKKCVAMPRCQFVDNTCDCGSIEDTSGNIRFMCSKKLFSNLSDSGTDRTLRQGVGYCTWCSGRQTDREYSIPEERKNELESLGFNVITKDSIDWSENCSNRCNNYSECEVSESEELWNRCVYDNSNGLLGVNYNDPQYTKESLRTDGFCYDPNSENIQELNRVKEICEKELESLGSINKGRVFSPGDSEVVSCNYRYNWYHDCLKSDNQQISQNYLCTWCPSLQCRSGSMDEICGQRSEMGGGVYCRGVDGCECYMDTMNSHSTIDKYVLAIPTSGVMFAVLMYIIILTIFG